MRLKYFMRGLGSGIVLTAAVVALTTKPKLSDAEIIERAIELGMVSIEEAGLNEGDLEDLSKDDATDNGKTNNEDPSKNDENIADETSKDETSKDETSKDETSEDKTSPDKTSEDETNQKPEDTKVENSKKTVKVTINKGMYSYAVSKTLEEAGVIDSAKKFDQFLIKYDYQRKIIPGSYEFKEGISYDQIAEIITK